MARSRMSTTRLRTQTRVQFVVEVGESRARATTPSPNLKADYLAVTPKWAKKLELHTVQKLKRLILIWACLICVRHILERYSL